MKSKDFIAAEKTGCIAQAVTMLLRNTIGEKEIITHYAQILKARLFSEPHFSKVPQLKAQRCQIPEITAYPVDYFPEVP